MIHHLPLSHSWISAAKFFSLSSSNHLSFRFEANLTIETYETLITIENKSRSGRLRKSMRCVSELKSMVMASRKSFSHIPNLLLLCLITRTFDLKDKWRNLGVNSGTSSSSEKVNIWDINGANIVDDPNGRVKVVDFGLAKHDLLEAQKPRS